MTIDFLNFIQLVWIKLYNKSLSGSFFIFSIQTMLLFFFGFVSFHNKIMKKTVLCNYYHEHDFM